MPLLSEISTDALRFGPRRYFLRWAPFLALACPYVLLLTASKKLVLAAIVGAMFIVFLAALRMALTERALVDLIYVFVILIVFQNVLIGPFIAGKVDLSTVTLLLEMKTYYIIVLLAVCGIFSVVRPDQKMRNALLNVPVVIGLGLALAAIVWAFVAPSSVPVLSRAAYVRDLALPGALLAIGCFAIRSRSDLLRLVRFALIIAGVVVVFGLIERFLLGDWFWKGIIHGDRIWAAKQGQPWQWMLPGETAIFGHRVRRLASTFLDGVNTAFFLASVVAILLAWSSKRWRPALVATCGIALFLTLGRGGIIVAILVLLAYFLSEATGPLARALSVGVAMLVAVLVGYVAVRTASAEHLSGLTSILRNLPTAPLGHGLGSGGNFAEIAGYTSRAATLASGGESTVGSIGYQMGIVGLLLWSAFLLSISIALLRGDPLSSRPGSLRLAGRLFSAAILSLFILSFAQESVLSPPANFLYFIMCGAVLSVAQLRDDSTPAGATAPISGPVGIPRAL